MPLIYGNTTIEGNLVTNGITASQLKLTDGASNGYILQSDANGNATWVAPSGTGVTGSGTTNYVPKWSGVSTLTSTSSIYDDGSKVGILTNSPGATLDVRGSAVFNENGGNFDFRIEGDTDTNLFFVDASLDNIGIGTSAITGRKVQINQGDNNVGLYLSGNSNLTGNISLFVNNASTTVDNSTIYAWNSSTTGTGVSIDALANSSLAVTNIAGRFTAQNGTNNYAIITQTGDSVFNESGGNYDFRIEGDTDQNLFAVNASRDNIGIGVSTGFMDSLSGVKLLISNTTATSSTNQGLMILSGGSSFSYGINIGIGQTLNTGVGDIGIISSVSNISTSNNTYNYYGRNSGSSLDNKYGIYSEVSGNGLSNYNYGVYSYVFGANLENYGNYVHVLGTYSANKYGYYSLLRGTNGSSTINYGSVINIDNGFKNVGLSIGMGSNLSPSGDYGILNYVSPTYVSNQTTMYGEWIQNGGSASVKYGLYVDIYNGTTNYGVVVNRGTSIFNESGEDYDFRIEGLTESNLFFVDASNDSININSTGFSGFDYKLNLKSSNQVGFINEKTASLTTNIANMNLLYSNISNATSVSNYTTISATNSNSAIGDYIQISGTPKNTYGAYYEISGGTVSNNGIYISVTGSSEQVTGIYVDSWKSSGISKAIVTERGISIFNESGGDYDFRIEGLTESNLFLVDASNDNIGIGTALPDPKSILDLTSTTKGFLPPRMTESQRENISTPPAGLIVFDTTLSKHYGYTGTTWSAFY